MSVGGSGLYQTMYNCKGVTLDARQTRSHSHLSLPVILRLSHSAVCKNDRFPKSIINSRHLFSSKRSKTHHSEHVPYESSRQLPQIFHFHNTPPQKRFALRAAFIQHHCPAKWQIPRTDQLYAASLGEFLPVCFGGKMSQLL